MATILIGIALLSLFLPYQEFKSLWADFDTSGLLNFIEDDSFTKNKVIRGYELVLPIIPVGMIAIGNGFSGFAKNISGKITGMILIGAGALFTLYLYLPLRSAARALPNSLSRPPVPIIGVGYYLLLITAILSIVFSVIKFYKHK